MYNESPGFRIRIRCHLPGFGSGFSTRIPDTDPNVYRKYSKSCFLGGKTIMNYDCINDPCFINIGVLEVEIELL